MKSKQIAFFATQNDIVPARAKSSSRRVKIAWLARVFNPLRAVCRSPDRFA